jgi:hypothetical protein
LGETIEELEKPVGAVRCIKDLLEETLKIPVIHAFPYALGQSWNQKLGKSRSLVPGQLLSAPIPN